MHAASSGRHEQKVGQFKSLMKKLEYEQELNEATLRERWEVINQMPSRAGELSPARLAFRRERRNPLMPILPQAGGEEETKGGKRQEERTDQCQDDKKNKEAADLCSWAKNSHVKVFYWK